VQIRPRSPQGWGERLGIDTPVNRTLVACVKGIERSYVH
jgi:ketopantoate reductase